MAKAYTVSKVMERTRLTDAGTLEKVYRVEAKTALGTPFTLELTEEQAKPEKAAELLTAKAQDLDKLLKL